MRHYTIVLPFCILVLISLLIGDSEAQQKKKGGMKMPSQEEMMKRWQEAMTPTEAHKKLEAFVGTWDAEVKTWMAGPDSEPSVSKGTSENSMSLGGRYLKQEYSGEMMGQPMSGVGYTGYDNMKKKYVGFWIDNMSTSMSTMEGTMEKDGKTITTWGTMDEPASGEKNKKVKYVLRLIGPDKHIFEAYDVTTWGEKHPVMEITYTRKKS